MTGVVLCGGKSVRMGSDKGSLKSLNLTWAEIATSKLSSLGLPVVVSINKKQADTYSNIFPETELVADDETLSVKGPLLGLLTVHQHLPHEDLLILACDMIDMKVEPLQNLLTMHKEKLYEAYVYKTIEKLEPLCAVYTSNGLRHILQLHEQQQLKKFSMVYALECVDTKYISADPVFMNCFANYNCVDDFSIRNSIT